MNVILTKDTKDLGFAGDIVDVAVGYARNFLVPQGLATEATPTEIKKSEAVRADRVAKHEEVIANADKVAAKLSEKTITLTGKVSSGEKLFGGFTTADIATAITDQLKVEIDKSQVHLEGGHIKTLGDHVIDIHLYEGKHVKIDVKVEAEG